MGANPSDSIGQALGASGAAFGILGAYMACWPNDRIEFPLLFFIRAWPVWGIVPLDWVLKSGICIKSKRVNQ